MRIKNRNIKDRNVTMTLSFSKDSTAIERIRAVIAWIKIQKNFRVMGVSGNKRTVKIILRKGKKYVKN